LIEELLFTGDFESLNDMAWCIADFANDCKPRDVELALRAAQRAVELTKQQDFAPLDTLARCWAWKGDFAKALSLEEHAIALAPAEYLPDLQRALDEYRAKTAKK
jgi:tetratricopeptide (TPR) repeat protein